MCLVFAVQTEGVYCQIGEEFLCTLYMTFSVPGRALALVVSHRAVCPELRVRSLPSPCEFCGG